MKSIEERLESFRTDMDILLEELAIKQEQKDKIFSKINKHSRSKQIRKVSLLLAGLSMCIVLLAIIYKNSELSTINSNIKIQSLIAYKSKTELIEDADIIISGKVIDILPSRWSNPGFEKGEDKRNIIQTDISIKINEIYKGQPYSTDSVNVRINKGISGGTNLISDGYPDFKMNEEVVLFLSKDDGDLANPDENYYVLTGMAQGKFLLKEPGKYISSMEEGTMIDLSTFKDEVKKQLE